MVLLSAAPRNGAVGFSHPANKEAYTKACPTPTAERPSLEFLRVKVISMDTVLKYWKSQLDRGKAKCRRLSPEAAIIANTTRAPPWDHTE